MNQIKDQQKKKMSKVRAILDIFFFLLMVLVLIPQSTGIPIHEWASFIILLPFFLHLIINWNWISTNSTKLVKGQLKKTTFDYFFNWVLYFFMITVTVSGIVISEAALPVFGIHFKPDNFWSVIHNVSATLFMVLLGVHLALHWKWIKGAIRKLKIKSDFHHLTAIGSMLSKNSRQLLLIVVVSVLASFAIWFFEYSEWADSFRVVSEVPEGENSKEMPKGWMIYVLPLVKVTVLMTIPALITGAILRLKKKVVVDA